MQSQVIGYTQKWYRFYQRYSTKVLTLCLSVSLSCSLFLSQSFSLFLSLSLSLTRPQSPSLSPSFFISFIIFLPPSHSPSLPSPTLFICPSELLPSIFLLSYLLIPSHKHCNTSQSSRYRNNEFRDPVMEADLSSQSPE